MTVSLPPASENALPLRLRLWVEGSGLLRLAMISIWVTTWYQALLGWRVSYGLSFLLLGLVLVGSYYLAGYANRFGWDTFRARMLFAVWLIGSMALSLWWLVLSPGGAELGELASDAVRAVYQANPDIGIFVHLLAVALVAWRGIALSQGAQDVGDTLRSFQVGLVMFLLYGLVFEQRNLLAYLPVYLFLLVSLLALATTRITDLAFLRGGRLPGSFREWALPILVSALGLVAVSLLAGWLLSQEIGYLSAGVLALVFLLLFLVSAVVALPVLVIIYLVMPWLQRLFSQGLEDMPIQNPVDIAEGIFGEELQEAIRETSIIDRGFPIFLGLILLVVILLVIFSLRSRRAARRAAAEADRAQSLGTAPLLGQPDENPARRSRLSARRFLAAARIRQVYARLLWLAGQLGTPRPAAATPLEFLPALAGCFPDHSAELNLITDAYLGVRYGELPETDEEIQAIVQAWKRIEQHGRAELRHIKRRPKT